MNTLEFDGFGPICDRRWMPIDETGLFVSQRSDPRLALVRVALEPDVLEPDALRVAAATIDVILVVFVMIY